MENLHGISHSNEVEIFINDKTIEVHIEKEYNLK
jgi:hypothetical protein